MTRPFRYSVFALAVLTTLIVLAGARSAWSQPSSETPAAPTAPAKTDAPKIQEINDAVELFKQREFDECEKMLEKAVRGHREEQFPPPPIILAQFFAQAQQGGLMRMALEKAALKYPDDPESYVIFGNMALQDRRVTDAALLYAKAKELLTKLTSTKRKKILEPQTISGLAAVSENRDEWKAAQTYLETLLQTLPSDSDSKSAQAQATLRLARSLFKQKKAKESYEKLRAAYELDKENILSPEAALGRF
jgi:hypothetical protein